MKLSIITPVYNDPRVERALRSVREQEGIEDLERVVIDGASTGPTERILSEWKDRIDVLVSEPDEGIYDAMNKGIELATGDVIGILNADDRYQDNQVLRDVIGAFQDPKVRACYGDLVYVDEDDEIVRYWKSGDYSDGRWRWGWMPPHPTFFVRREVYEELGIFDLEFPIAADYELMLRFLRIHGIPVKYLDRVLVRMATGGNANSSPATIVRANLEVKRAWRKHDLNWGALVSVFKPLRKILQFLPRN